MCQNCVAKMQDKLMVGLTTDHLKVLENETKLTRKGIISRLFLAMTSSLSPHLPALATFVAMIEFVKARRYGVLSEYKLVRVPLSIIGIDRVRYRLPILTLLHEAILSLRMSEITVKNINSALTTEGMAAAYLCSCGLVMGKKEDIDSFLDSKTIRRLDKLRSAIDTEGNPVQELNQWTSLPDNMDLSANGEDQALIERISNLTLLMAKTGSQPDYSWVEKELSHFVAVAMKESVTA